MLDSFLYFCARSCSFKRRRQPKNLRLDLFIFFTKGINFKITSEDLLISIKGNYKFQAGNFSSLRLTLERAGTDGEVKIQVGKKPKGFRRNAQKDWPMIIWYLIIFVLFLWKINYYRYGSKSINPGSGRTTENVCI